MDDYGDVINTVITPQRGGAEIHDFRDYCHASVDFASRQSFLEARKTLSKACGLIPSILKEEDPTTIDYLLDTLIYLTGTHLPEVATLLTDYIRKMSEILLKTEHSLGRICRLIGSIEPGHLKATLIKSYECLTKAYTQSLGQFHIVSLSSQLSWITYSYHDKDLFVAEQRLRKLLSQCKASGNLNEGICEVLECLWYNLYNQAKYAESELVSFELLDFAEEIEDYQGQVSGLEFAAAAQHEQGNIDLAETNILEAIELIRSHWKHSSPWALERVVYLQSRLRKWGLEEEAAELGAEIEHRMVMCKVDGDE